MTSETPGNMRPRLPAILTDFRRACDDSGASQYERSKRRAIVDSYQRNLSCCASALAEASVGENRREKWQA
jgi:hypothetical protein